MLYSYNLQLYSCMSFFFLASAIQGRVRTAVWGLRLQACRRLHLGLCRMPAAARGCSVFGVRTSHLIIIT